MQLVCGVPVVFEVARRGDHVGPPLADRLAGVVRFERAEVVEVLQDRLGDLHQYAAPLDRGETAPCVVEGGAGGAHGAVDLGRARARDRGEGPPVRGADDLYQAPVLGLGGLAADQVAVGGKAAVGGGKRGCVHVQKAPSVQA